MRIVIKLGTSTLTHATGHLNIRRVELLAKVISDINGFWGDYQAGEEAGQRGPLVNFTFDDMEPSDRTKGGNT